MSLIDITSVRVTIDSRTRQRVRSAVERAGSIAAFAQICGVSYSVIDRVLCFPGKRINNATAQKIFRALRDTDATDAPSARNYTLKGTGKLKIKN